MDCTFCKKTFSTAYTLKTHQNTSKTCMKVRENHGVEVAKLLFSCTWCNKELTTKNRLTTHLSICKLKLKEDEKKKEETEQEIKKLKQVLEETHRDIKDTFVDEIHKITSDVKNTKEEFEIELRIKDDKILKLLEQNKQLEQRTKQLEEKSMQPTVINNNQTIHHNYLTIFTSMSPERVKDMFDKHYTIETLMGGQKALADFVVDRFVTGQDGMIYLCVDRSRKKVCYTTNFSDFIEDTNHEVLLSHLAPAYPVIKSKVEWSEYEKKYNPFVTKIHDSYDEILAIRTDGTNFRSQLCRRLPASLEDKERMDSMHNPLKTLDTLRQTEEKEFVERKEEIDRIVATASLPQTITRNEAPLVPNQICGFGLGRLDVFRLLYKNQGVYKIYKDLEPFVLKDPEVAKAYEDYVKRGTYKGKVIWE